MVELILAAYVSLLFIIKLQGTNQSFFLLRKLYPEFGQIMLLCNITPPTPPHPLLKQTNKKPATTETLRCTSGGGM